MHDELMDRLAEARPITPAEVLEPDARLLEKILTVAPLPKRRVVTPFRLAGVAAVAAALVAVMLVVPRDEASTPRPTPSLDMRAIVESTNAALTSGRAHVHLATHTDKLGPIPRDSGADFTVEFNGDDRSMLGTVDPGDGRSSVFPIANRVVAGQFYLQDGIRWVKDTNAADMSGDDVFSVDPRRFLGVVAQQAAFKESGRDTVDGVPVRHLEATRLDGIPDFNLGLGPTTDGTRLTAFELWVDSDDVVRGLLVATEQREKTYPLAETVITKDTNGNVHKSLDPATMGDPVIVTITQRYKVTFAEIGEPIAITAPAGAVAVAGKG